jgi:hypothetical protein
MLKYNFIRADLHANMDYIIDIDHYHITGFIAGRNIALCRGEASVFRAVH